MVPQQTWAFRLPLARILEWNDGQRKLPSNRLRRCLRLLLGSCLYHVSCSLGLFSRYRFFDRSFPLTRPERELD
jgi:hypothetical protein